jgi:hypothetical protein
VGPARCKPGILRHHPRPLKWGVPIQRVSRHTAHSTLLKHSQLILLPVTNKGTPCYPWERFATDNCLRWHLKRLPTLEMKLMILKYMGPLNMCKIRATFPTMLSMVCRESSSGNTHLLQPEAQPHRPPLRVQCQEGHQQVNTTWAEFTLELVVEIGSVVVTEVVYIFPSWQIY